MLMAVSLSAVEPPPVDQEAMQSALRTRRFGMHLARGVVGTLGNICFFWTITHMLLADSMALQFSRPLFMIPLALLFLGEIAGWRRTMVTVVGFMGIALYARPFTDGFDPGAFVGAAGALFGAHFEDERLVAAHAEDGGDAVFGVGFQLVVDVVAGKILGVLRHPFRVAEVAVEIDEAGDNVFAGEFDDFRFAGRHLHALFGADVGDAAVGDDESGVGKWSLTGAVNQCESLENTGFGGEHRSSRQ